MGRKIGEGHAAAMFRLGLRELRNAINPSRESVADHEIGVFETQTQGEIADARGGPGQGPEQESRGGTMSLDALRASAKELSPEEDQSKEQGRHQAREQSKEQNRGGREM